MCLFEICRCALLDLSSWKADDWSRLEQRLSHTHTYIETAGPLWEETDPSANPFSGWNETTKTNKTSRGDYEHEISMEAD